MTIGLVITIILFITQFSAGETTVAAALAIMASPLPGIWLPMFIEFGVYILIFLVWIVWAIKIWKS
jgi:hypothetical protein